MGKMVSNLLFTGRERLIEMRYILAALAVPVTSDELMVLTIRFWVCVARDIADFLASNG